MRYWIGKDKNNETVSEKKCKWNEKELKSLSFVLEDKNQIIELPDNMEYIQAKTCSADMFSKKCEIESRYIGVKLGNNNITLRINEKTGNIRLEINEC